MGPAPGALGRQPRGDPGAPGWKLPRRHPAFPGSLQERHREHWGKTLGGGNPTGAPQKPTSRRDDGSGGSLAADKTEALGGTWREAQDTGRTSLDRKSVV